jgi:hypothetical protein
MAPQIASTMMLPTKASTLTFDPAESAARGVGWPVMEASLR